MQRRNKAKDEGFERSPPKVYAHRGGRGLFPENTLPAYHAVSELGVAAIDMDIGMTKDQELVVTHDFTLNPVITRDTSGQWVESADHLVSNLTLAELQTYDVGRIKPGSGYHQLFSEQQPIDNTPIPTFREVIHLAKKLTNEQLIFQIEVKTNPLHPEWTTSPKIYAETIAKIIDEEKIANRIEIQAFDYRCLLELQKINPSLQTAYLTHKQALDDQTNFALWSAGYLPCNFNNSIPQMIAALGGKIWGPQDIELTPKLVEEAHQLGLKVIPWGWPEKTRVVVDMPLINQLVEMGVDGIITDRPDILLKNL